MNKIYIYNKETLELSGVPFITTLEEFKDKPTEFYPDWDNRIMIIAETELQYPIIDEETGFLRDKTREERILLDDEQELLNDGEYVQNGEIIFIKYDESLGYLKKVWDKEQHIWKEGATEEEIKDFYYSQINKFKAEILETGFDFNTHQQKCREKDLALLGNAVSALDDMQMFAITQEEKHVNWAFNDNDIVNMTETELRKMRIAGAVFINTVYGVEAELKSSKPNIILKKEDFIIKVNELSEVKCYKATV